MGVILNVVKELEIQSGEIAQVARATLSNDTYRRSYGPTNSKDDLAWLRS